MFELWNNVCRAMGNVAKPGFAAFGAYGKQDVRDARGNAKFAYSIHGVASGCKKLSKALPICTVSRGLAGMRLPKAFREANHCGGKNKHAGL